MLKTIKTFVSLFALVGILSACSSTGNKDETSMPEPTPAPTPVVETVDNSMDEAARRLEGVANVFYFEFDQSTLNSEARAALTVHAEVLNMSPRSVRLEGHADERGSREYNMALGERRSKAVQRYLVLQGVSPAQLELVSYGEERAIATGNDESSWAQNRRVELRK